MSLVTTVPDPTGNVRRLSVPCLGDVVVTEVALAPPCFTLHQVPGEPQVRCSSGDTAIDVARGFARRHGVDAWLSDGESLTRLAHHRPVRL